MGTVGNITTEVLYLGGIAVEIQDMLALEAMAGAIFAKERLREGELYMGNISCHEVSRALGRPSTSSRTH